MPTGGRLLGLAFRYASRNMAMNCYEEPLYSRCRHASVTAAATTQACEDGSLPVTLRRRGRLGEPGGQCTPAQHEVHKPNLPENLHRPLHVPLEDKLPVQAKDTPHGHCRTHLSMLWRSAPQTRTPEDAARHAKSPTPCRRHKTRHLLHIGDEA